ncbi:MAG: uracil-DNA glycosylase [Candidatus Kapaibacterium sp.]|nr:MAG: uracil-DNA glycosylase [Candidatus Kapabacteria bacterium]
MSDLAGTALKRARALLEHLHRISGGYILAPATDATVRCESASPAINPPNSASTVATNPPEVMHTNANDPAMQSSHLTRMPFRLDVASRIHSDTIFASENDFNTAQSLEELYDRIHTCTKCPLGATRTKFVFGSGNPHAEIVFIGEAPGADEDQQGEPFVGRAGQLLTKILAAIELDRRQVYICNILKCRPPGNRRPLPTEAEQCEPYLYKQLQLINPPFLVALGLTAAETLLRRKLKMADARGQWYNFYGGRLLVTYHPAALLRNPELKRDTWEDVKRLRAAYDTYRSTGMLPEPTS